MTAEQMQRALARLFVSEPQTRWRVRKVIRAELANVAKRLRQDAKGAMMSDPRKAYRAVKTSVYKKILGGNVSILNPRKAGARYQLVRERKLDLNPHQWGGNRRPRSLRTTNVDTYYGKDRAFILRFVSSGTKERVTRYGNRGFLPGNGWFQSMAPQQMERAAENISRMIEEELAAAYAEQRI